MRAHAQLPVRNSLVCLLMGLGLLCGRTAPAIADPTAASDQASSAAAASKEDAPDRLMFKALVGRFAGKINTPMMPLRISVEFTLAEDGTLRGLMDIPQQGAKSLVIEPITLKDGTLEFKLKGIPGDPTFVSSPTIEKDEKVGKLSGSFKQGALATTFELTRGELAQSRRRQDPRKPYPYEEEQVRVRVEASARQLVIAKAKSVPAPEPFELAGTITKPKGDGPFPAVLLITGSGAQNRDEELLDHRPFLVLADALTRGGMLVLRCDDRSIGESGGDFTHATSDDFADDALACVKFLRARADVGPIGLIGHSEGGLIAPIVATQADSHVDFVVMLAGCGVRGRELLRRQNELLALASGVGPAAANEIAQAADHVFAEVNKGGDREAVRRLVLELLRVQRRAASGQELAPVKSPDGVDAAATGADQDASKPAAAPESKEQGASADHPKDESKSESKAEGEAGDETLGPAADAQTEALLSPWFRRFLTYDPCESLSKLTVPVLAINGSLDLQVDADQNLPAIERCLAIAENPDVSTKKLMGFNHLFQRCGGPDEDLSKGSIQWYALHPDTMDQEVLDLVREWIVQRFPPPAGASSASPSGAEAPSGTPATK